MERGQVAKNAYPLFFGAILANKKASSLFIFFFGVA
jgi:hypothetical protein